MALDDTGSAPSATDPPAPLASQQPDAAGPATPAPPDVRGLIDQSRKMGATDDQIRDLMVKAPFLKDTWQASEKAGISPDAVFEHFGLAAPKAGDAAATDQNPPAVDDFGRPMDIPAASTSPSGQSQVAADVNAVGQGLVGGTGSAIAGTGRQITAAAARLAPGQLAAMDAIDRGEQVPADQDVIGYGSMSDEQKASMRADFPAAAASLANRDPNAITRAGMAVEGAAPTMFPVAPEREGIQTGAGRMIGGLAPVAVGSLVGTAVAGPAGGLLAAAAAIGSQTYDGVYQEATAKGSTPAEAEDAAGKAALAQMAIMSVPVGRVLQVIPVPLREGFAKTLVNIGQSGIEVGGGNALATLAQNYVAQQSYDPTRPITQGIGAAGLEGTIAGLVIRGGGVAVQAARASAAASDGLASIGAATNVDGAIAAAAKATTAPDAARQAEPGWGNLFGTPPAAGGAIEGRGATPLEGARPTETADAGTPPAAAAASTDALAPQSAGAAASSVLDPGVGNLTPKQELAYRSTAEGQKLLEPQSFGTADNTAYIPGVTPNAVETSQSVQAAREFKALKTTNPDVAEEAAAVHAANSDARQQHFEQLSGSDVDVLNAVAARNRQMDADTATVWAGKEEADSQPVVDAANAILETRDGRRPLVRNVINSVLKELRDRDGNPITDPEVLYGVGDHINDLLDENDAGGQKKNGRASSALLALKDALYDDVIEPAAPGFRQALDNYRQASARIDEMTVLQKFEPKLYDANSRMTYAKVQTMMRQIVDSRQAPGLNPYKSISDDTMAGLWDLRDDLRRTAAADNLARTPGGSDTTQSLYDAAKQSVAGVGSTILHAIPVVGDAVKRGMDVAQPLLDARAAKARSVRGMAILHPDEPPIERSDQATPDAPAAAKPIAGRPPPPDLLSNVAPPAPPAPVQTQLAREQAAVAAMKARSAAAADPVANLVTPSPNAASGNFYNATTALTPAGTPVPVRYLVREASDLTPSQLPDGRPNPAFPPELQPRDRTRAASMSQVASIANGLAPERLGYAADTATGAPVVGPDGIVESGNGRTMAIQKAYAEGSTAADSYRTWLAGQGFDVAGMRQPVLVRERTAPLDMAARAKLADAMGASPTMAMAAPERAAADAKRIPTEVLSLIQRGDVTSVSNAAFVRAFATHAIPASEHASFMTADGDLSVEGATRVRNALTQRAYGSNELVTSLAENADPELKAFGGALLDAAGPMAKLRGAIEDGSVGPGNDITAAIVEAAQVIQTAKRARTSVADAVAQTDAFAQRDPRTESVLRATFGDDYAGRMSRPKLAGLLANFAAEMQVQSGLFGENKTADQVFEGLARK